MLPSTNSRIYIGGARTSAWGGALVSLLSCHMFLVDVLSFASDGRQWREASGKVIKSAPRKVSAGRRGAVVASIAYEYQVDGQTYTGSSIGPPDSPDMFSTMLLQTYPYDAPVTVWYDASDPGVSCLIPGRDAAYAAFSPTEGAPLAVAIHLSTLVAATWALGILARRTVHKIRGASGGGWLRLRRAGNPRMDCGLALAVSAYSGYVWWKLHDFGVAPPTGEWLLSVPLILSVVQLVRGTIAAREALRARRLCVEVDRASPRLNEPFRIRVRVPGPSTGEPVSLEVAATSDAVTLAHEVQIAPSSTEVVDEFDFRELQRLAKPADPILRGIAIRWTIAVRVLDPPSRRDRAEYHFTAE